MLSQAISRQAEPVTTETRLMLRAAQLYYRLNLTQDQVGERLGVSRFKVGRLLDRALRESAVRIEIVHPAAGLVDRPLSHEEVLAAGAAAADRLRVLLGNLVNELF